MRHIINKFKKILALACLIPGIAVADDFSAHSVGRYGAPIAVNSAAEIPNVYLGTMTNTSPAFIAASAGAVIGPASSTDNAIARFDSTTGKIIQNSVVLVGDTGNITGAGTIGSGAITSTGAVQGTALTATTGDVTATLGNFVASAATKGLVLKTGSNGRVGTFTCTSGGDITVSNTSVAASDFIGIGLNTAGGTVSTAPAIKSLTPTTGFHALCATNDTSVYNYVIISNQ